MQNFVEALGPSWFHGVDAVLEFFSFLVAFLVAFVGLQSYRVLRERKYLALSGAFFLLAVSFAARMGASALVYLEVARDFSATITDGGTVEPVFLWGRFFYIVLVFTAYLLLTAIALRLEDPKTNALLFLLLTVLAWQAHRYPSTTVFYIVKLIMILFVVAHFFKNYWEKRTKNSLLIFLAFTMIACEVVLFIGANEFTPLYMAAYVFRFIGYLLLSTTLLRVMRA